MIAKLHFIKKTKKLIMSHLISIRIYKITYFIVVPIWIAFQHVTNRKQSTQFNFVESGLNSIFSHKIKSNI